MAAARGSNTFWLIALAVVVLLFSGAGGWLFKRTKERDAMKLRYFKQSDFGPYWPMMSADLLAKLDEFRDRLGYPVEISPAVGAIGRPVIGADGNVESGAETSYHNYAIHGEVKAIDVLPKPPMGATAEERRRWVAVAKAVGFTGIGIYPDWKPRPGVHLDVRPKKTAGDVSTWAGIRDKATGKQVYTSIEKGLA